MLITIKNYSANKLEQKFINENFALFNYIEYKKTVIDDIFDKAKDKDFILVKDITIFNNEQLINFRNKAKAFNIKAIIIDNTKKYNANLESISDYMIQVNDVMINPITNKEMKSAFITKCIERDLNSFPFINVDKMKL